MPRNPIIIINNIWSEIKDLPPGGSDLLYDVLSFNVPDARFIIRYSNSNWDGKKHLFYRNRKESSSGKFRTGLVARTVQSLYDKFKILPVIIDQREKPEKTLNLEWNEKDFKLRDYQIEAVSNSIRKTRAVLEISTGGGKCVNEGTLCITEDGILPISYFALPYIGHEQYDTINLKIMNDGGTDCAKKIYYDGESNDSISIQTSTGYGIIGTKEHKIKILNKNGELEWKKLKNIEKKDTIAICRKPGIFGKSDLLKEDDAYFMGILCGDGSCVQRGTIIITNQDRHILDFCCGYLKKNNIKYTLKDSKSKAKDIFIHNVKFRKKLFLYGLGFEKSINKKWPIEILKSPSNIIASFVVGLFETDGWVENRPSINIGLSNKEFIRYLQIVLLNFGIIAQLQIKETSHQTSYVLHIYAENIKLFLEKIGLDKNGYKYKKIINCLKDRKYKKSNPNKDLFYADKKEFKQFYSKFKDRWRKIKLNYKDVFFKEFGINYNYFIACCRGDENIGSTMESNVISSKFYKKIYNKKIKINKIELKNIFYEFKRYFYKINTPDIRQYFEKEIKIKARTFYSYIGDRCPSLVNMRKISDYSAANNINVFEDKSLFDGTYYYDKIKKIKTVVSKNYDFVIPGSKTFIGNGLINHNTIVAAKIIQELGVAPFIFYVLTKDLMEQARERIEQSIIGTQCGVIGDGKCDIQDINVVTIQTAIRAFEKDSSSEEHKINDFLKFDDYEEFDIEQLKKEDMSHLEKKREEIKKLILNCRGMYADECHHISAQTCQEVISKSTKSYYMFGGSATPIRSDNSDLLIEGLLGRKSTIVSASHLIRLGYLMRPDIYYIKMKQNNSGPIFSYEDDLQLNLINNESRNRHISTIAQTMSEKNLSTLILISRIEHGKILNTMIPNSVFIYGETDSKKRTETLQMLREKKILICIASTIGDEGLDIPTLNCVIIAGGGKSPIKCKQKVGRAIRMYPEKKMSIIFDFLDKGKYLTRHSKKRMFLLKQEPEFNIKTIESFDIKEHYTQDVF